MPSVNIELSPAQLLKLHRGALLAKRSARAHAAFLLEEALSKMDEALFDRRALLNAHRSKRNLPALTDQEFLMAEGLRAQLSGALALGVQPHLSQVDVIARGFTFDFEPWWPTLPVGGE